MPSSPLANHHPPHPVVDQNVVEVPGGASSLHCPAGPVIGSLSNTCEAIPASSDSHKSRHPGR